MSLTFFIFSFFCFSQDYAGQELSERLFSYIIIFFTFVGLVWGYYLQDFYQTLYVLGAGVALAAVVSWACLYWRCYLENRRG